MSKISEDGLQKRKAKKGLKIRSITWDLTVTSVLVIVVVSTVVIWLSYFNLSRRASATLEKKADEYIILLESTIEIPLWDLNLEHLEDICKSYISNDLIVSIRITDAYDEILVEEGKEEDESLIRRSVKVHHNGEFLAEVEISLTPRSYMESNRQLLWSNILTICVVFIFLSIFSIFFLRKFIKKSFKNLNEIVSSYAVGKYNPPIRSIAFREFQEFVTVLAEMGERITTQIEELRNAEEKYRSIFENAIVGIYRTTPDGRFINANLALARMLGYDSPGKLLADITDIGNQLYVNPKLRKKSFHLMEEHKSVNRLEAEVYHKDGSIKWVIMYDRPVYSDEGKLLFSEGVMEDITARKQAEVELSRHRSHLEELVKERSEELEKAKDEAESANKYKSEFLANMSHEIRTPMNAVLGFTDILIREEDDPGKKEKLATIKEAGRNLLVIINDILDFTKIESGKLELEEVCFNPSKEFETLLGLFTAKAGRKDIRLSASIDPALPAQVSGDLLRIKQVLTNLLGNALKFTPEKGSVVLEITRIAGGASSCTVLFSVSDNGIGIAEEKQKLIFEAFTQADSSVTRKFGGTGLGLTISSNLVRLMGGKLKMESKDGNGSRFFFGLELEIGGGADTLEKISALGTETSGAIKAECSVLVAEDNRINQQLILYNLEGYGLVVDMAENGKEAVEMFKRNSYDLIFMDVSMPVMNGIEALKQIIEIELSRSQAHTPVVALTAHTVKGDREKFLEAGMDDFLSKPFASEDLHSILLKYLEDSGDDA